MQQITFEVDNKKDASLLIEIAEKLGIKKYKKSESRKQLIKDTNAISPMIEADSSIDTSSLTKIFTGKNINPKKLRTKLWQREK